MKTENIHIGNHIIGVDKPVFMIAEAGVNHNGDIAMARRLIDIALSAGADAVKFQTFNAEKLVTSNAPKATYQLETTETTESQLEMLKRLELSATAHRELKDYCDQRRITFLSTPFDEESADFLESLGVQAFKLSSGDLTNFPLIAHVAKKGKPLIVSTGMADIDDVAAAVRVVREAGCRDLVLLHCVSNYPAHPADVNLRAIETMRQQFHVPVGFSDHTAGIEISLAAVALGAVVIEKHFTLDKNLPGPDHKASLEADELRSLILSIRSVELALGDGIKRRQPSEEDTARVARRSIVAAQTVPAGTILTPAMTVLKRPGSGLSPAVLGSLLGKRARRDIAEGSLLQFDMFE